LGAKVFNWEDRSHFVFRCGAKWLGFQKNKSVRPFLFLFYFPVIALVQINSHIPVCPISGPSIAHFKRLMAMPLPSGNWVRLPDKFTLSGFQVAFLEKKYLL
jgi:hypothetical protein